MAITTKKCCKCRKPLENDVVCRQCGHAACQCSKCRDCQHEKCTGATCRLSKKKVAKLPV